jgi:hypothetical protein
MVKHFSKSIYQEGIIHGNAWYIVLNRCSAIGHGSNKISTGWLTTKKLVMQPPNPSESWLDSYNNSGQDERVYNGH